MTTRKPLSQNTLLLTTGQERSGWRLQTSGTMPVAPETFVHIAIRAHLDSAGRLPDRQSDEIAARDPVSADQWDWSIDVDEEDPGDIVAYRVATPPDTESRRFPERDFTLTPDQIAKGWKYHTTGVQPVTDRTMVGYLLRVDHGVLPAHREYIYAQHLRWDDRDSPSDIVAYKENQP